jgi:hypothetical protein
MYIFDVWANHQDNRQAILLKKPDGHAQEVVFIDHGHMFGGPDWHFRERPGVARHLESLVYSALWHRDFVSSWISHFENVIPDVLSCVISNVPADWYKGDLNKLQEVLLNRLADLTRLFDADEEGTRYFIRRNGKNAALQLSEFGICGIRTPGSRYSVCCDSTDGNNRLLQTSRACPTNMEESIAYGVG